MVIISVSLARARFAKSPVPELRVVASGIEGDAHFGAKRSIAMIRRFRRTPEPAAHLIAISVYEDPRIGL
jgi:hypothetical protein